jgi:hypothetical protein
LAKNQEEFSRFADLYAVDSDAEDLASYALYCALMTGLSSYTRPYCAAAFKFPAFNASFTSSSL